MTRAHTQFTEDNRFELTLNPGDSYSWLTLKDDLSNTESLMTRTEAQNLYDALHFFLFFGEVSDAVRK